MKGEVRGVRERCEGRGRSVSGEGEAGACSDMRNNSASSLLTAREAPIF